MEILKSSPVYVGNRFGDVPTIPHPNGVNTVTPNERHLKLSNGKELLLIKEGPQHFALYEVKKDGSLDLLKQKSYVSSPERTISKYDAKKGLESDRFFGIQDKTLKISTKPYLISLKDYNGCSWEYPRQINLFGDLSEFEYEKKVYFPNGKSHILDTHRFSYRKNIADSINPIFSADKRICNIENFLKKFGKIGEYVLGAAKHIR